MKILWGNTMSRSLQLSTLVGLSLIFTGTHAAQIAPNPNPVGNTILVEGGTSDSNSLAFTNNGWITVQQGNTVMAGGELTNSAGATLTNNGLIQTLVHPINSGIFINAGLVENHGTVEGPNRNELGATFNNYAGASAGVSNYGQVTNAGTLGLVNYGTGVVDNTGLLRNVWNLSGGIINNAAAGEIRVGDPSLGYPYSLGSLVNHGTINNSGAIVVNDDSNVEVKGDPWGGSFGVIHSDGTINVVGINALFSVEAGATVDGTGTFIQDEGTTRISAANVDVGAGPQDFVGRLTQGEIVINGGTLAGTGVVESVNAPLVIGAAATIAPGNSPGTLTVEGDIDLDGLYIAEVDSLGSHDVLNVTGTATLGATSQLQLIFSFAPAVSDVFDVLVADSIVGDFSFIDATFPPPEGGGEGECGEGCGEFFLAQTAYSSAGYGYDVSLIIDAIGSLDVLRVTITSVPVSAVPLPAAAWLFGGALGLLGWVRRRAS